MVIKKTTSGTGKKNIAKLKLKKETIKDLDVKGKSTGVKGGQNESRAAMVCSTACRLA